MSQEVRIVGDRYASAGIARRDVPKNGRLGGDPSTVANTQMIAWPDLPAHQRCDRIAIVEQVVIGPEERADTLVRVPERQHARAEIERIHDSDTQMVNMRELP